MEKAKCLINELQKFTLLRILNEENFKVDTFSRLVSSDLSEHIRVVYVKILKVLCIDKELVMEINEESSWMDLILSYLKDDKLPVDKGQARSIVYKVMRYTLIEGKLYKRSFTMSYLRSLHPTKTQYVLVEVHEDMWTTLRRTGISAQSAMTRLLLAYNEGRCSGLRSKA